MYLSASVLYIALPSALSHAQSLDESIFAALENNPRIDQARADLRASREQLPQARAQFRPQASFESSISATNRDARLTDGQNFNDSAQPYSSSIRLSQPLYTGGLKPVLLRRARLSERAERFRFQDEEVQLALDVTSAFFDVIAAQERLKIQAEVNRFIFDQIRASEERYRLEVGTLTDVAQVKARYAASEATLITAQTDLVRARATFEAITGIVATEPRHEHSARRPAGSLDEAIELAKEHSPALKSLRAQYDAGRMDVIASTRQNRPQVSWSLEARSARESSPAIERDDDLRATLSLSIPLMDGGARNSRKREALANRNSIAFALREQELQLGLFVTDVWLRLDSIEAEEVSQSARMQAAELALDGVIKGQAAGLWSTTDVLEATEQQALAKLAFAEVQTTKQSLHEVLSLICGEITK